MITTRRAQLFKLAADGDATAQGLLGQMYLTGVGVPQDLNKAQAWIRDAAKRGDRDSQALVEAAKTTDFFKIRDSASSRRDRAEALAKVATDFELRLALWAVRDRTTKELRAPPLSQLNSATRAFIGNAGTNKTVDILPFAERGFALAQEMMAILYERGDGVPKDLVQAARWFKAAAEQGLPSAQGRYAEMLLNGHGVPRNPAQAIAMMEKGADGGDARAQYLLGQAYERGEGIAKNDALARAWYLRSAALGHAEAIYRAATFLERGVGGPPDAKMAYDFYETASEEQVDQLTKARP